MRLPRTVQVTLAAGAVALGAAACGGGGANPRVAALGNEGETTTTAGPASSLGQGSGTAREEVQMLAYAVCMRKNGVPGFPDPANGTFKLPGRGDTERDLEQAYGASPAQFGTAQNACQHLMVGGPPAAPAQPEADLEQGIKISACIRAHGFPNFPDPVYGDGPDGPGVIFEVNTPGLADEVSTPQFQAAQSVCNTVLP